MSAQTRSEIAELLDRHGLAPIHRLGQHFLADPNITRKIVAEADIRDGDQVLEVGAGTGTLTSALVAAGAHVVAYEVDSGLEPALSEVLHGMDVDVRIEDITKVDLALVVGEGNWKMVANLPYNVGTPLLMDALRTLHTIKHFVVLVQKEVAERLVAVPGSRDYGIPSVVAQIYSEPRLAFVVPPQVFLPPPNVGSAVVVMNRVASGAESERAVVLAQAAFGQRRKMLRRSLSSMFDDPAPLLVSAGVDPTSRAEELGPGDYLRMARLMP